MRGGLGKTHLCAPPQAQEMWTQLGEELTLRGMPTPRDLFPQPRGGGGGVPGLHQTPAPGEDAAGWESRDRSTPWPGKKRGYPIRRHSPFLLHGGTVFPFVAFPEKRMHRGPRHGSRRAPPALPPPPPAASAPPPGPGSAGRRGRGCTASCLPHACLLPAFCLPSACSCPAGLVRPGLPPPPPPQHPSPGLPGGFWWSPALPVPALPERGFARVGYPLLPMCRVNCVIPLESGNRWGAAEQGADLGGGGVSPRPDGAGG